MGFQKALTEPFRRAVSVSSAKSRIVMVSAIAAIMANRQISRIQRRSPLVSGQKRRNASAMLTGSVRIGISVAEC